MPTSNFWTEGTSAESAAWIERGLAAATEKPSVSLVEGILESLVRHQERRHIEGASDDDVHRTLMQRVTEVLTAACREVFSFIFQTSTLAGSARDDEQLASSWRRSAIQLIFDEHAPVIAALEPWQRDEVPDLVESVDDELRRMGTDYGRLPDEDLPRGLPQTHWWWWPEPKPGYERWPGWDEPP